MSVLKVEREFPRGLLPLLGGMFLYAGSPVILAQTASLFINPIMEDTGLPASAVAVGPVIVLTMSIAQPLAAALIIRFGTRPLAYIALASMALGMVALWSLPASWWTFYVVGIFLGLGGTFGFLSTQARYLSLWFRKNFGLAMGIVGATGGIVPFVLTPILSATIAANGWRSGFLVLLALVIVFCFPTVIRLFREPKPDKTFAPLARTGASSTDAAKKPLGPLFRDPLYVLPLLAYLAVSFATGGFVASIAPILLNKGFDQTIATVVTMCILAGVVLGRVLGGFALDRVFPYLVPIVIFTLAGLSAIFIARTDVTIAAVVIGIAVLLIGSAQGAEGDMPAIFIRREFGMESMTTLAGWAFLTIGVAAGTGGLVFAAIRDATGKYDAAAAAGGIGFLSGAVLFAISAVIAYRRRRATARGFDQPETLVPVGQTAAPRADAK